MKYNIEKFLTFSLKEVRIDSNVGQARTHSLKNYLRNSVEIWRHLKQVLTIL